MNKSDIKNSTDMFLYTVEGRYSIIHDDINEADRYIVVLEKLIEIIQGKSKKSC